jgi:hypothetical protein
MAKTYTKEQKKKHKQDQKNLGRINKQFLRGLVE